MKKKKTIFVVEDSLIIAEIISIELKNAFDCEVFMFENGDDVINQIVINEPDLIVLDYNYNGDNLQYNNGLDLLVDLRKTCKIPVIIFSGQRNKEKALELIRQGANDYINKDDSDFIVALLKSISDIFNLESARQNIKSIKNRINKNLYFLAFLLVISLALSQLML